MLKYSQILSVLEDLLTAPPVGDILLETAAAQITNDSRQVIKDAVFVAIPGSRNDGLQFVPQALQKGAKVIISQTPAAVLPPETVNLCVSNAYTAYARLCEAFYDYPANALKRFAITGTNGKTTSVMIIRALLNYHKLRCGLISTVEYDTGCGTPETADRTTPEAGKLFQYIAEMRDNHLDAFAMEVSSHALHQNRIGSLKFDAAIFSNLTGDHLDYHHTFEDYFCAKRKLFIEHLAENGIAVINCDDAYGRRLSADPAVKNVVSFGQNSGLWQIKNVSVNRSGSKFTLTDGSIEQKIQTNAVGLHNIYNITGAVLALHHTGILPLKSSAAILGTVNINVPGRLETFILPSGATAIVDYAHTSDALKNAMQSLKQLSPKKIICVFGAGGDRDKSKRPLMGRAVAEYANVIYLTSDNPRSENPLQILEDIKGGIPAGFKTLHIIPDRREAVNQALQSADAGDIVLIAGKGHEDYQEINGVKHHFDDREIVRNFCK